MHSRIAPWTEPRIERAKELWAKGLSARQIADELGGGVSRNGVIGKLHRLGLSGTRVGSPEWRSNIRRTKPQNEKKGVFSNTYRHSTEDTRQPPYVPPALIGKPKSKKLTIEHLSDRVCKWPGEENEEPPYFYCGHDALPSLPFCEFHAKRAYQNLTDEHIARLREIAAARA